MNVLKQNCDPSDGEDKSLPYTCYLVWYEVDGVMTYDLAIPRNKVELFDYYWDRYREDLKGFKQSEGRVNPKVWQDPRKVEKKKK